MDSHIIQLLPNYLTAAAGRAKIYHGSEIAEIEIGIKIPVYL
jgi:hypothetical protein